MAQHAEHAADHSAVEVDAVTGRTTTGHEWDGIKELNTPLPRWWLILFYLTILWSIGYWIVYPSWPGLTGHFNGALGWNSRTALTEDVAALQAARGEQARTLATASLAEIKASPTLLPIAMAQGRAAFATNCAGCHGLGAQGFVAYPNLNDDDWLWGGTLDAVQHTIRNGIRNENPESRQGAMPPFGGANGILKSDEITAVTHQVLALANLPTPAGADLAKGREVFAQNCAVCHGEAGKGNQELGAPDLTDAIWLFGSDEAAIRAGIVNGRGGVMPAWGDRLDAGTINALTVYVHSLGGGK